MTIERPDPPFDAIPAAWASLTAMMQAELGCMLIEMVFASFVSGDAYDPIYHYCNEEIRDNAWRREHKALNELHRRVEVLFPDLFGLEPSDDLPEGEDPPWAWRDIDELGKLVEQRYAAFEAADKAVQDEEKRQEAAR